MHIPKGGRRNFPCNIFLGSELILCSNFFLYIFFQNFFSFPKCLHDFFISNSALCMICSRGMSPSSPPRISKSPSLRSRVIQQLTEPYCTETLQRNNQGTYLQGKSGGWQSSFCPAASWVSLQVVAMDLSPFD